MAKDPDERPFENDPRERRMGPSDVAHADGAGAMMEDRERGVIVPLAVEDFISLVSARLEGDFHLVVEQISTFSKGRATEEGSLFSLEVGSAVHKRLYCGRVWLHTWGNVSNSGIGLTHQVQRVELTPEIRWATAKAISEVCRTWEIPIT